MFHSNVTYVLIPFHMRFSKRGQRWGQKKIFFSKPLQNTLCDLEDLKIVIHLSHLTKFFSYRFLDPVSFPWTQFLLMGLSVCILTEVSISQSLFR